MTTCSRTALLYIVLFLHQTTTSVIYVYLSTSCISYYSYIKPQQWQPYRSYACSCISYYSYIKPQQCQYLCCGTCVVYRTIPTSNHNFQQSSEYYSLVVYRTIPTSNHNNFAAATTRQTLYIVLFLHQTTTTKPAVQAVAWLYIVLFLHQTTTVASVLLVCISCISYYSYIKPQLCSGLCFMLHCCISYYSYIKPQRMSYLPTFIKVVYRTIPTSNHNTLKIRRLWQ